MDSSKPGLFSSLSLGRASRSSKPPTGNFEPVAHPLLGSSTSLQQPSDNGPDSAGPSRPGHTSSGSWSKTGAGEIIVGSLPYKPRQRHGGGPGSGSSAVGMFGAINTASPPLVPTTAVVTTTGVPSISTSPVTPTVGVSAAPLVSTSTSTTYTISTDAYPPSAFTNPSDTPSTNNMSTATSLLGTGTLTSRLQLQSLKAAAQKTGLGNGTMGMSMIDAIFEKGQQGRAKSGEGGDWGDLLRVLMGGKAILLLPQTPSSSLPMTSQTLRDHIAFLSPAVTLPMTALTGLDVSEKESWNEKEAVAGSTGSIAVVVTLSGLVGTLSGSTITIESTLPIDSPLLIALRDTSLRSTTLSSLRPTHIPWPTSTPTFPFYSLTSDPTNLTFPVMSKSAAPSEAGKEAREKDKESSGRIGRMNPFASLFGGTSPSSSSTSTAIPSLPIPSSPVRVDRSLDSTSSSHQSGKPTSPAPPSPKPSFLSAELQDSASLASDLTSTPTSEGYQVTAYTISKPVRYSEAQKAIAKALRAHVRMKLAKLPDKIVDRTVKLLTEALCPFTAGGVAGHDFFGSNHSVDDKTTNLDFNDPSTTGEKLQNMMEQIYDELIAHHRSELAVPTGDKSLRRKGSGSVPWGRSGALTGTGDSEHESIDRSKMSLKEREEHIEREASEGTERVEGLVCKLLYNRIFSPLGSDDDKHDEALASRIAALNMLDLTLDHLGLITHPEGEASGERSVADGLELIVEQIGRELQNLSNLSCLKPKEKADVLVRAHKIVVDGLAQLPTIELRPEGEQYKPPPRISIVHPDGTSPSRDDSPSKTSMTDTSDFASLGATEEPDPLGTISEANEATPLALAPTPTSDVPELVLPGHSDPSLLHEAMADSVLTITPSMDRKGSTASQGSSISEHSSSPPVAKSATSGADLILPIIIFAVVRSNPPQLASQLMYLRRYRSAICLTGEASYAIVNLTAVIEFLEHVDLAELGLGDESDKVMSVDNLSPIGLTYMDDNADAASIASASSRLRGRVNQVSELAGSAAGSANKVLTGVVDSSWTALRGLIATAPGQADHTDESTIPPSGNSQVPQRPGMRPRQASTFSLASVTASVANIAAAASTAAARNRSRASSRASEQVQVNWGGNQEMIEVSSRPGSVRESGIGIYGSDEDETGESDDASEDDEVRHNPDQSSGDRDQWGHARRRSDARSIRSVSSMMSKDSGRKEEAPKTERASLSNRLASIGVLGRLSNPIEATSGTTSPVETLPPAVASSSMKPVGFLNNLANASRSASHQRRSSLLGGSQADIAARLQGEAHPSPSGSMTSLPPAQIEAFEPAIERFLTCEVADLRLSEIGILLRDYRRLAGIVLKQSQASTGL